ncbi:hypothetical protein SAMN04487866_12815 [Thermoactinomyces sp. DSM 45891]|uniref:hypothetical protein n=1 Tax=Thermoactinomyces sp. DSM 45891 TaxID=1761907 RepID=UPI00091DBADF|nr:hypothetical protein [Thermoactinomyces sp. DSM 45891]SFX80895.1 hypothetical protein SAMN04487866_12815 [Thermoactinomyces sp. DSM 45891]
MSHYAGLKFFHNATDLPQIMQNLAIDGVDVIVSGLQFANFPQQLRDQILTGVLSTLNPGGLFITFQYSFQLKAQLGTLFSQVDISFIPINLAGDRESSSNSDSL